MTSEERADLPLHILVDFDRTMARYVDFETNGVALGVAIEPMIERIFRWLDMNMEVRIFTARASRKNPRREDDLLRIREWCKEELGVELEITNEKDFGTLAIWDDLAVPVVPNTGEVLVNTSCDPLPEHEEAELLGRGEDVR